MKFPAWVKLTEAPVCYARIKLGIDEKFMILLKMILD
jgi:hypothetical protein